MQRTVLYRVAQSALANVERHAQASRVTVKIQKDPRTLCLEIHDNGKSFVVGRVLPTSGGQRLGLLGMSERVAMVGGKLVVASAPGQGTTIRAELPCASAGEAGKQR